jgi:hypothetical protein
MRNDSGLTDAEAIAAIHAKGVPIDYGKDFRMMVMRDDLARCQRYVDALNTMDRMVTMSNVTASLAVLVPRAVAGDADMATNNTVYQDLMIWHCLKKRGVM